MAQTNAVPPVHGNPHGHLRRSVGFWGLMFVSLGSIIGSGWLLSALSASEVAGPAAILSWILAAVMLTVLALVYAELGATYPVAGGTGRFPYFSHGPLAGFVAGWASWLQAVMIAPIEVLAAIAYANSLTSVQKHFNMVHQSGSKAGLLNGLGLIVAAIALVAFTAMNLAGAQFMAESNSIVVIWKTAVPLLSIVVIAAMSFHLGNFHSTKGGFMPHGIHGVFEALPLGVVFALQGFEQAVQLAGEARNPKRDLSRAIITAMAVGGTIYVLLQFVFIGAVEPSHVAAGWANPLGGNASTDQGAWHTLALAVGAGWLAAIIVIDGVVSPSGTGIVYVGTSARLSYALGEEREMPNALASTNKKGTPVVSILVAFVVGLAALGPFPSWNKLVNVVTGTTAIMYAFAPVSLAALRRARPGPPADLCDAVRGHPDAGGVLFCRSAAVLGRLPDDVEDRLCADRRLDSLLDRRLGGANRRAEHGPPSGVARPVAARHDDHRCVRPVHERDQRRQQPHPPRQLVGSAHSHRIQSGDLPFRGELGDLHGTR